MLAEIGNPAPPIDGIGLATAWDVGVRASSDVSRSHWQGSAIRVPRRLSRAEQSWQVARQLGHWGLWRAGCPESEQSADLVAEALLLPREAFSADLRATLWDLRALAAIHCYCPHELIARRIVSLRSACAAAWLGGAMVSRHVSPWLPESYARVTVFERELAADALVQGCTLQGGGLSWALALGRCVITVCEAEEAMRATG